MKFLAVHTSKSKLPLGDAGTGLVIQQGQQYPERYIWMLPNDNQFMSLCYLSDGISFHPLTRYDMAEFWTIDALARVLRTYSEEQFLTDYGMPYSIGGRLLAFALHERRNALRKLAQEEVEFLYEKIKEQCSTQPARRRTKRKT